MRRWLCQSVVIPETIAALPEVAGFGNVPSLRQAMARDTSGRLKYLVQAFINNPNPATRLRARYDANPAAGQDFIESFGRFLRDAGESGQRTRAALQALGNPDGSGFLQALSSLGWLSQQGDDNDNILSGEADQDNHLIGLGGNDRLYGENKADTLNWIRTLGRCSQALACH